MTQHGREAGGETEKGRHDEDGEQENKKVEASGERNAGRKEGPWTGGGMRCVVGGFETGRRSVVGS